MLILYREVCDTVNEEKCDSVSEEVCDTVTEEVCESINEEKCETVQVDILLTHCYKNPIYVFPEKELRRPQSQFSTFMCL
jgi:hypothetical protein